MSVSKPSEIEKIRYDRLRLVCRKALEQVIKNALSIESLQTCYPEMAETQQGKHSLQNAREQIIRFWHSHSIHEFDMIFKERNVEQKLNELDEIIQLAQYRKDTKKEQPLQIDKLDSNEIIESTLLSYSAESIDNLNMIYSELCSENAALYDELKGLSKSGVELKLDIEDSLNMLNKEIDTLDNESSRLQLNDLINSFVNEY